jgi:hypothetical protein
MVLAITLLNRIREVAGSNFGRTPTILTEVLRSIPQSHQIIGEHLEVGHDNYLQHAFQFIIY